MAKKKPKERVYATGTKIIVHMSCAFSGCDGEEEITLDEDTTETELNKLVDVMTLEFVEPEGWFEIAGEDDETSD